MAETARFLIEKTLWKRDKGLYSSGRKVIISKLQIQNPPASSAGDLLSTPNGEPVSLA
jgi:hypothetical protein